MHHFATVDPVQLAAALRAAGKKRFVISAGAQQLRAIPQETLSVNAAPPAQPVAEPVPAQPVRVLPLAREAFEKNPLVPDIEPTEGDFNAL